jgi:hypothetical protein
MKEIDAWYFGILIEVYWVIKRYEAITNNMTYIRKSIDLAVPYKERNIDPWFGQEALKNCWKSCPWVDGDIDIRNDERTEDVLCNEGNKMYDNYYKFDVVQSYGRVLKKNGENLLKLYNELVPKVWEWLDLKNAVYRLRIVVRYDHFKTRELRRVRRPLGFRIKKKQSRFYVDKEVTNLVKDFVEWAKIGGRVLKMIHKEDKNKLEEIKEAEKDLEIKAEVAKKAAKEVDLKRQNEFFRRRKLITYVQKWKKDRIKFKRKGTKEEKKDHKKKSIKKYFE